MGSLKKIWRRGNFIEKSGNFEEENERQLCGDPFEHALTNGVFGACLIFRCELGVAQTYSNANTQDLVNRLQANVGLG